MKNQISVLVADENKELLNSAKSLLEENENVSSAFIANNGEEALNNILQNKPDVVVLDILLSGIDGFTVIEEAKKNGAKCKFIVTSALSSETFVQKAMNLGVEYYMVKPVVPSIVLKRIIDLYETTSSSREISNANETEKTTATNLDQSRNKQLEEKITNILSQLAFLLILKDTISFVKQLKWQLIILKLSIQSQNNFIHQSQNVFQLLQARLNVQFVMQLKLHGIVEKLKISILFLVSKYILRMRSRLMESLLLLLPTKC